MPAHLLFKITKSLVIAESKREYIRTECTMADTNVHLEEYHRQFLCVLPLHLGPNNQFNNKHV